MTTTPNICATTESKSVFFRKIAFMLVLVLLLTGLGLAIVSWARVCSQACAEGHNYRLYGYTFESIGIPFFGALLFIHLFSQKFPIFREILYAAISTALGAELMFTYAQKYIIGHWCPVCLSIAACIFCAFLVVAYQYLNELSNSLSKRQKGAVMKSVSKGVLCAGLVFFGFFFSQAGLAKFSQLQAAENSVKDNISFGNQSSHIEVYVFSDWECPSCRQIEPVIEKANEEIGKKARLIFVDLPIHPESMNFTPYNLSFMIKNKPQYLQLRNGLTELSTKTNAPTEAQIEEIAKKAGIKYAPLNYSDISVGQQYFKHLATQFNVDRTPTVIVVNKDKKKGKKLIGSGEITQENILHAIDSLAN